MSATSISFGLLANSHHKSLKSLLSSYLFNVFIQRGGGYTTPSSSFTMGQQYPPHQASPTSVTDTSYLYSQAPPPLSSSSNHRSPKPPSKSHLPRGSTKLGGGHGSGEEQPTPQNLRDSPERLAKVKTEMCTYFLKGGIKSCPYGKNCEYKFISVIF